MSNKIHLLDEELGKVYNLNDRFWYYTPCGNQIGISSQKLKDDEVFMKSSIDHTRDKEKVTCKNCQKVIEYD